MKKLLFGLIILIIPVFGFADVTLINDTFTDTNGVHIHDHSANTNNTGDTYHTLSLVESDADIQANTLRLKAVQGTDQNYPKAYIDLGTSPSSGLITYTMSIKNSAAAATSARFIFASERIGSASGTSCTGYAVGLRLDGSYHCYFELYGVTNNAFSSALASTDIVSDASSWFGIKITYDGNSITGYCDKSAAGTTKRWNYVTTLNNTGSEIAFYSGFTTSTDYFFDTLNIVSAAVASTATFTPTATSTPTASPTLTVTPTWISTPGPAPTGMKYVYMDAFTDADGTTLVYHTADVDLPGSGYYDPEFSWAIQNGTCQRQLVPSNHLVQGFKLGVHKVYPITHKILLRTTGPTSNGAFLFRSDYSVPSGLVLQVSNPPGGACIEVYSQAGGSDLAIVYTDVSISEWASLKMVDTGTNVKVYLDPGIDEATTLWIDLNTASYASLDGCGIWTCEGGDTLAIDNYQVLINDSSPTQTVTPTITTTKTATLTATPYPTWAEMRKQFLINDSLRPMPIISERSAITANDGRKKLYK